MCYTKSFEFFLLNIDNKEIEWYLVTVSVSSYLWTGETWAIFKIWGNMPSAKDWLIIKLKGFDKMSKVFLRITKWIVEPKPFHLCNWDISFRISSMVVDLSANEISERF